MDWKDNILKSLDSRRVFSSLASVYGLEQLPTEMVQRVEVMQVGDQHCLARMRSGRWLTIITKGALLIHIVLTTLNG
ncbi:hypothetical protein MASR1M31_08710 [Porphyromonadaceae bacterium]